mmetsp:Transcript_15184/g.38375  ORF Transcript_15184/g.38375 Transcript_15184/m.38375 type:complete len:240 (+) Transcript_15184:362-1081(+)
MSLKSSAFRRNCTSESTVCLTISTRLSSAISTSPDWTSTKAWAIMAKKIFSNKQNANRMYSSQIHPAKNGCSPYSGSTLASPTKLRARKVAVPQASDSPQKRSPKPMVHARTNPMKMTANIDKNGRNITKACSTVTTSTRIYGKYPVYLMIFAQISRAFRAFSSLAVWTNSAGAPKSVNANGSESSASPTVTPAKDEKALARYEKAATSSAKFSKSITFHPSPRYLAKLVYSSSTSSPR